MAAEEWRTIPWAVNYEVSDQGRVRRLTGGVTNARAGHILAPVTQQSGYLAVRIGGALPTRVHRIVCRVFHGEAPANKPMVLHANDIRSDNRAINLRWGSAADNAADARANGPTVRKCARGHEYAVGSDCRACANQRSREYRSRQHGR